MECQIGKDRRTQSAHPRSEVAHRPRLRQVQHGTSPLRAVVKLATERKHLTDIIKMLAYQAESDLLNLPRSHYLRAE